MTTLTLLERLRSETRTEHEQMEATFQLPETRADLLRWVAAFFGFLEPLEEHVVRGLGSDHALVVGRTKAAWLREDLRALGLSEGEIAALPRCLALPPLHTRAQMLGALYVFEGATLGGQIISKHIESALGLTDGAGYRYFRSYGPDVGRRWHEFRALLLENPSAADDEIVASARATFAALRAWCLAADERN